MCRKGRWHRTPPPPAGQGSLPGFGECDGGRGRGEAAGPGGPAERSEASTAVRPAPAPYLESNRSTVPTLGATHEESHLECRAVGCRSRFCQHCCKHLALKLRGRLVPVLRTFKGMLMLTLTIDPKLFQSPAEAYWYVKGRRAIPKLIAALVERGHLKTGRYFYVLEWHKNGWAHFHVLVEAELKTDLQVAKLWFDACKIWGKNRPKNAPAWDGTYRSGIRGLKQTAPEFGTVKVSKRDFANAEHGANYALKYMMKQPEEGFPQWVFDEVNAGRRIRVYDSSRKLLPSEPRERKARVKPSTDEDGDAHDPECFCEACRLGAGVRPRRKHRPLEERLASCGKEGAIVHVSERKDEAGNVVSTRRSFWRRLEITFREAMEMLDCQHLNQRWVRLREGDLLRLSARRSVGESVVGGGVNPADVASYPEFDEWNARAALV